MKILFVFNHPAPYKVALFNGLATHFDVHVIFERKAAKNRNSNFYSQKEYKFTTHQIRGINLGNENHFSFGVKKHLKNNKYDLVIINGYSNISEMIALQYLKKHKLPYVFYINGGAVKKESKLKRRIKTYFISGATNYFSPALKANDYLIHYGAEPNKIINYPYSTLYKADVVTEKLSTAEKVKFWKSLNIKGQTFTICATSFIKRKNNASLIKSWANIANENALILVGQGEEKQLYLNIIKEARLTNVFLLPFADRKTLFTYLQHADNAIYISNYDIYGHVINEALAHGLNVLTNTKMIAAFDLIKNGENGLILQEGEDLTAKINELFTKDFFTKAIESCHTIEDEVSVHVRELNKLL